MIYRTGSTHVLPGLPAERTCHGIGRDLIALDRRNKIRSAFTPKPLDQVAATCALTSGQLRFLAVYPVVELRATQTWLVMVMSGKYFEAGRAATTRALREILTRPPALRMKVDRSVESIDRRGVAGSARPAQGRNRSR